MIGEGCCMPENIMRAVRYHEYGPPEVLVIEQVPRPEPGEGEVLVRVHAAGVNPFDWKSRQGYTSAPLPAIPGLDLAGVVETPGPGVTEFQQGQAVYGVGRGTYAEYAVARAGSLAPKPRNLSFDEAASVPISARTAWASLFDTGGLQPGQRLLVHGAAGGVGVYAVQFGRWKGAHVIGTASAGNLDFIRSLGAEMAIDYKTTPFENVVRDVDIVLDTVGGATQKRSWQVLRPGGILIALVSAPPEEKVRQYGVRATSPILTTPLHELLRRVGELFETGVIVPVVQKVFPLEQVRQAHALSETGHGRGRIVLHIAD